MRTTLTILVAVSALTLAACASRDANVSDARSSGGVEPMETRSFGPSTGGGNWETAPAPSSGAAMDSRTLFFTPESPDVLYFQDGAATASGGFSSRQVLRDRDGRAYYLESGRAVYFDELQARRNHLERRAEIRAFEQQQNIFRNGGTDTRVDVDVNAR